MGHPDSLGSCAESTVATFASATQRKNRNRLTPRGYRMYIYADESGHTGKHIFNEPEYYFQGALLSTTDVEPILATVAGKFIHELGVERLHANELPLRHIENITSAFIELLSNINWKYHITIIEKQYLSITKFVDSLFDSHENKGSRWLWYNHELFRHSLCILFDEALSLDKKKDFWTAYLRDDHESICLIVEWVLSRLNTMKIDKRLREVATDGLKFALKYPKEITLMASLTKKSYKGHTPNMVAFSSLIQAVHTFCDINDVTPKVFVHDSQSEFSPTMREYHKLFSRARLKKNDSGLMLKGERVDYDFGKFSTPLSRDVISLQACDLFLSLFQKMNLVKSIRLKQKMLDKVEEFHISRYSSENIVFRWLFNLANEELSEEQLETGKRIVAEMEEKYIRNRDKFEAEKFSGATDSPGKC
jgi:hypothetical protein